MWLNLPWVRLEGMVQPSADGFGGGEVQPSASGAQGLGVAFRKWGSEAWRSLPRVGLGTWCSFPLVLVQMLSG